MAIHSTAIVDSKAEIDPAAEIGPYVVIDGPVKVGAGTRVYPHAYLTGWTEIGKNCQIHPGTVVGGEPQDFAYDGSETYCRIGDETILREGVSVHRGTAPGSETVIGKRCFLMTNAHVGHNCIVADDVKMTTGAVLGGHCQVQANAFLGGYSGLHQFCRLGELVMLGGFAKIMKDIPPYFTVDVPGKCVGVNTIGMRRAGFSTEQREDVKNAFRVLYRSGKLFSDAVAALADAVTTEPGRKILEFVTTPSKRGIAGGGR